MPRWFNNEMPFALYDRAMLDAHYSAVAHLLVFTTSLVVFHWASVSAVLALLSCRLLLYCVFISCLMANDSHDDDDDDMMMMITYEDYSIKH